MNNQTKLSNEAHEFLRALGVRSEETDIHRIKLINISIPVDAEKCAGYQPMFAQIEIIVGQFMMSSMIEITKTSDISNMEIVLTGHDLARGLHICGLNNVALSQSDFGCVLVYLTKEFLTLSLSASDQM